MLVDILLSFALLWLSVGMVLKEDLFSVVIYFIVFGMILALVWVRLFAFDLALAEIALGSGITGALLLDTIAFLKIKERETHNDL
jgi:energy-converting hydrogenase B subunit D